LVAHWGLVVQACPLGSKPLQTPVCVLHPLLHCVRTRVPFSQRADTLPWQLEAEPSHSTQREPSAVQNAPLQVWAQHTVVPAKVPAQNPEPHSLAWVQDWPRRERHESPTGSLLAGQVQAPSEPQTLPVASQPVLQQRSVPLTSSVHRPDSHCPAPSHGEPVGRSALH
jgi:hypothetical protein